MKKIISLIIAIIMLASLVTIPTFAEELEFVAPDDTWTADADGNFTISDVGDLLAFSVSSTINGYYAGKTVKLAEDIDMTGIEWFPVAKFMGTFDGNGHAIKGVKLVAQTGRLGFFTLIENATIQNVRFLDFYVSCAQTDNSNCVGLIAGAANHACSFKNVYTSGTVSASIRASGFVGAPNTQHTGVITFENCATSAKLVSQRAGGFVAQVHPYTTVKFTDCAFFGDLSEAGRWSSGFTGLTVGEVEMTRCVSYANVSSEASKEIGSLVFLDHQNNAQAKEAKSKITLEDCYAATATGYYAIGTQPDRGFNFELTVKYGGTEVYHKFGEEESTLTADREAIEAATQYIACGNTVNVTKDNFATKMPTFTTWADAGMTATYMAGKTVDVFVPASVKTLMDAPFTPKVEEQQPTDTEPTETEPTETQPTVTEPTATETQANATEAPTSDTQAAEEGGCASAIGVSALAVFALAGGAMMIARKRRED